MAIFDAQAIPTISGLNVQRSLPSPIFLIRNIDFL